MPPTAIHAVAEVHDTSGVMVDRAKKRSRAERIKCSALQETHGWPAWLVAQHTSCRSAAITFAIQNGNTANDSNACAQLTQSEADVQSATTGDQQVGSLRATITSYPDDLAPRVHQYCVPFDVVCDTNQDTVSLGNLLGEGARRGHYPWGRSELSPRCPFPISRSRRCQR